MVRIHRIANSCLTVTGKGGTTLFDPGFFCWDSPDVDLEQIGDVQRVMITHVHADHVKPEFVRWLVDRGQDVTVHGNADVAKLLAEHDLACEVSPPSDVRSEDLLHEVLPHVADRAKNRAWTVDGVTHPGDSFGLTSTGAVLALPLLSFRRSLDTYLEGGPSDASVSFPITWNAADAAAAEVDATPPAMGNAPTSEPAPAPAPPATEPATAPLPATGGGAAVLGLALLSAAARARRRG